MNASTPYVATGSWVAPDWGRSVDWRGNELDSPLNTERLKEIDDEKMSGVRSHLKGVVIRHTESISSIFGIHINELPFYIKTETDDRMTKEFLLQSDKKGEKIQPYFQAHLPLPAKQANASQSQKSQYFDVVLICR